jgi:hypothetical protein
MSNDVKIYKKVEKYIHLKFFLVIGGHYDKTYRVG